MKIKLPNYSEMVDNPVLWENVKPGMLLFTYSANYGEPMLFHIKYKSERGISGVTYELIYHILIDKRASLEKEEYVDAYNRGDYFVKTSEFPKICYYTIEKIFDAEDFEVFG